MAGETCPACGRRAKVLWVHGHGQCTACGSAIEPCCEGAGEELDEPGSDRPPPPARVAELLAARGVSLTRDALLWEICARTGCSYDAARRALEAAERLRLVRCRNGVCSLVRAPGESGPGGEP